VGIERTVSWPQLKELHEEMIGIVRAHEPSSLVLLAGRDWAYERREVIEDPVAAPGVGANVRVLDAEAARPGRLATSGSLSPINHGKLYTMKTTIDRAGRIVVPKALRQALGLQPGSEIELRAADGRIEMEPAPLEVRLERKGGLLVAVPTRPVPLMPAAVVDRTATAVRTRRVDRPRRPR
jgi:AbrB family looped-hinge helix DNA binding protein